MSSSEEVSAPSCEETDSGSESESFERCHGGQGRKSRPRRDKKKDLKRKGSGKSHSPKATDKKRKMLNSEPAADTLEQPPARPAAQKLCPVEQIGENFLASLLRKNFVVSTDCSPCNKNLLECFADAMKDSLFKICDETPSAGSGKGPFECISDAVAECLLDILGVAPSAGDQNPWEIILERLAAIVPSTLEHPPGPA
jgi:hypothetical protein